MVISNKKIETGNRKLGLEKIETGNWKLEIGVGY
jgi:hypothetical protein